MKRLLITVITLLLLNFSYSQNLKFSIDNLNDSNAILMSLSGENFSIIRTITTKVDGKFEFNIENNHPGIYRLGFNNNKSVDFIYDNEDVEIETDAHNIFESIKVSKSKSNKIYYDFIKLNKDYKTKTELLQLILARYPKDDDYYQTTKEKLIQVQVEYLYFVNSTAQANPNSFIARYVRCSQLPVVDVGVPFEKQLTYLKTHALDNVNFYDDELIYSDTFTNKSIEYLTYYRNPQLPIGLLEKEFESAIDSILNKAKVNDIVYRHIVEYLLDGFKKFGFDNVINYIVDNYVIKDDICLNKQLSSALDKRLKQSKLFVSGSIVPDITLPDSTGSLVELTKIETDKILIVFYASWCPHCNHLIPEIFKLYKNQNEKKFDVLAVSIDTSKTDWMNFIQTNKLSWLNVNDVKGWDGKAALDYCIYATPTMFLINRNQKLISKPTTIEEIITSLK